MRRCFNFSSEGHKFALLQSIFFKKSTIEEDVDTDLIRSFCLANNSEEFKNDKKNF